MEILIFSFQIFIWLDQPPCHILSNQIILTTFANIGIVNSRYCRSLIKLLLNHNQWGANYLTLCETKACASALLLRVVNYIINAALLVAAGGIKTRILNKTKRWSVDSSIKIIQQRVWLHSLVSFSRSIFLFWFASCRDILFLSFSVCCNCKSIDIVHSL